MSNSLVVIQGLYFRLESHFNEIFNACETEEQRDVIRHNYVNARDTWWAAQAQAFNDSDPIVIKLIEDTSAATERVDQMLANLQDIVATLQVIREAVGLASKLATLAGVPA